MIRGRLLVDLLLQDLVQVLALAGLQDLGVDGLDSGLELALVDLGHGDAVLGGQGLDQGVLSLVGDLVAVLAGLLADLSQDGWGCTDAG